MNRALTLTTAALAATLLAGCTTTLDGYGEAPEPTVSAAPTFEPADGDQDGTVTGHEQEQYDRKQPREYVLADGTAVTLTYGEPLPENVKQDLATKAPEHTSPSAEAFRVYLDEVYATTGAKVLLVFRHMSGRYVAMAFGQEEGVIAPASGVNEAVAAATAWADSRDGYQIIVVG